MTPTILINYVGIQYNLYVIYDNLISPLLVDANRLEHDLKLSYTQPDLTDFRDILTNIYGEPFYSFNYCMMVDNEIISYITNDDTTDEENEKQTGAVQ